MPRKRLRQAETTASTPKRARTTTRSKPTPKPTKSTQNSKANVSVIPPRSTFATSFLLLPRELRDQIYHEAWLLKPAFEVALPELGNHHHSGQEHGPREYYHIFKISYPVIENPPPGCKLERNIHVNESNFITTSRSKPQPCTAWILASKQILYEAMLQFNQKATWTYSACHRGQKTRQLAAWRLLNANSRSSRISPILLALSNAANVHVPGQFVTRLYAAMDMGEAPFLNVELRMDALKLLHPLVSGISGTMALQRLSLQMHASTWWRGYEERHVMFMFKPLDSLYLPKLQVFKLTVTCNDRFFASQLLMQGLREGISVLGRNMLGGKAKEEVDLPTEPSFAETAVWVYSFSRQ